MSEDDRFDMATMIEELDAEKPSPEDLVKGEILKKMPETVKALMLEEEISLKLDASDCMKPIENKAFNSGVDFEDWMEVLDKHCKLGIFYN